MIQLFDALLKIDTINGMKRKLNEKIEQIKAWKKEECGNCHHWMKSSCKPEKESGQYKTCGSLACRDFLLCHRSETHIREATGELENMGIELNHFMEASDERT